MCAQHSSRLARSGAAQSRFATYGKAQISPFHDVYRAAYVCRLAMAGAAQSRLATTGKAQISHNQDMHMTAYI